MLKDMITENIIYRVGACLKYKELVVRERGHSAYKSFKCISELGSYLIEKDDRYYSPRFDMNVGLILIYQLAEALWSSGDPDLRPCSRVPNNDVPQNGSLGYTLLRNITFEVLILDEGTCFILEEAGFPPRKFLRLDLLCTHLLQRDEERYVPMFDQAVGRQAVDKIVELLLLAPEKDKEDS